MHKEMNFTKMEEEILKLWNENKAYEKSKEISKDRPEYVFYDGPPFATGLPHYGHILSGTVKDTIARFFFMQGYQMEKKFGWDCHGLPVEYEIDKMLSITTRQEVLNMGIENYNKECKNIVLKYTKEWEKMVERMGRWIDFNGYKTMDLTFMESVWYIFSLLYKKDKVYKGHKVMPYSTACSTPLSNFEANQNYKEVSDPSILIYFPLINEIKGKALNLIAWTTTPWTLPSNLALLINKEFEYLIFKLKNQSEYFCMLKDRISSYFKEFEEIETLKGEELLFQEYTPCFDYFSDLKEKGFFKVYHGNFVSKEDGTGIVHCAPGFGEEDYNTLVEHNLIKENEEVPCPIDEKGKFTSQISDFEGLYVKDADKLIINKLKNRILFKSKIMHRYPFCWRSDTPLLYKTVPNWFIKVKEEKENLLKNNLKINWVPENVKYKKFHNWLSNAKDWSISRNRFWGTPIPLWENEGKFICVSSVKELEELSGVKVNDLHREFIDKITIEKDGLIYKRIDEVFDCWFESGSMPYAQKHYPNNEIKLPADFIGEGVDQTRGWFYTLHVISTILFDSPSFKNCIVNGIVLAEDGKKMSKRLKNYPDPSEIFNKYGADALRLYLISSPVVVAENLNFTEKGVNEIVKNLLIPWFNSLLFCQSCNFSKTNAKLEMDDWLINSFNSFSYKVYEDVKKYHLSRVYEYSINFIDDLSNWYIRMNRNELREGGTLLKDILIKFSIVMAPFVPFFSEYSYQQLIKKNGSFWSVHFNTAVNYTNIQSNDFDLVKKVIEGIRNLRETNNISLKTPLNEGIIICEENCEKIIKNYLPVIKKECFLLKVTFKREENYEYKITVKPNFNEFKKKEKIKEKINLINNLKVEEIKLLLKNLKITKDSLEVELSETLYTKEILNAGCYGNFDGFSVILDTKMTDELLQMKFSREFYSAIQKIRKKAKLNPQDSVLVFVNNKDIREVVSKYYEIKFTNSSADNFIIEEEVLIDEKKMIVQLFEGE